MIKYECHGCGKIYDDEVGMPGKCCGKTIRHKVYNEERDIFTEIEELGYEQQYTEAFCSFKIILNNCAETTMYFTKREEKDV